MNKVCIAFALAVCMLLTAAVASAAAPPAKDSPPAKVAPATKAAATEPAPPPAPPEPLIKQGARGDDVKMIQKLLADTGFYAGEIDGIFGGGTLAAVKDFQTFAGLKADGVVGKETIAYLQREKAETEPGRYSRQLAMTATAYTVYDAGNGNYTSRGHAVRKGLVAVDPNVIPLGTRLYITGYGYAIADDIGGAIRGNKIDLAFESRDEALQFGRQRVTVYILN